VSAQGYSGAEAIPVMHRVGEREGPHKDSDGYKSPSCLTALEHRTRVRVQQKATDSQSGLGPFSVLLQSALQGDANYQPGEKPNLHERREGPTVREGIILRRGRGRGVEGTVETVCGGR
jgi:hypothetical protein